MVLVVETNEDFAFLQVFRNKHTNWTPWGNHAQCHSWLPGGVCDAAGESLTLMKWLIKFRVQIKSTFISLSKEDDVLMSIHSRYQWSSTYDKSPMTVLLSWPLRSEVRRKLMLLKSFFSQMICPFPEQWEGTSYLFSFLDYMTYISWHMDFPWCFS